MDQTRVSTPTTSILTTPLAQVKSLRTSRTKRTHASDEKNMIPALGCLCRTTTPFGLPPG